MTENCDQDKLIKTGRRVLATEGLALAQFSETLDENFAKAVELMLSVSGRIVVCGMGKSGHVARKIAATFASTGSPAQFVHPAEASHGDMGMLTKADVVLVLSNSGETPELADVIAHTRRFGIPMIGVAAKINSTLLQQSDIAILLPNAPEACTVGMAPTTSTTMTMALGDALAVAMMEHRSFTHEDFHSFHPGGQLGAKLASVGNLMHGVDDLPLVSPDTLMSDALLIITQKGFGIAGVVKVGSLSGVITDGDLRRNMDGLLSLTAQEVMTADPMTISATSLAAEALGTMNDHKITTLFVTETSESRIPIGIIHLHDCLRAGLG